MCRIAGFWDFNYRGDYGLEEVAIKMRDTLSHGGPDDAGLYVDRAYFEDKGVNHYKLWLLFVFELWRERWM